MNCSGTRKLNNQVKKVLFITYHFPPRAGVGSIRPRGVAKYLPRNGYDVIILTVPLPGVAPLEFRVVETDFRHSFTTWVKKKIARDVAKLYNETDKSIKFKFSKKSPIPRVLEIIWGMLNYPDEFTGWHEPAIKAALLLAKQERIDYILSSSPPVSCHIIASKISRQTGIPWVADFRDLWTQNLYYPYDPLRKMRERWLEKKTIAYACALTTISPPLANQLDSFHKKPVYSIPNGYDPDEEASWITGQSLSPTFTITHTGRLYDGKRDPTVLFEAIRILIDNNIITRSELEVRFFGERNHWVDMEIEKFGLKNIVHQFGYLERKTVIDKQRESHMLLLLGWDNPNDTGTCTGKLFEYLAAHRPIISIGGPKGCAIDRILTETRSGDHLQSNRNVIADYLKQKFLEYKSTGNIAYCGEKNAIEQYSHQEMAVKFSKVFSALSF